MSNIGDTTPRSIVSSCGSRKTPSSLRPVCTSSIAQQTVQQTPRPESWYIAAEKRMKDFQNLRYENNFIRQFMDQQLNSLRSAIDAIPIKPTIKKVRNTLLKMVDHKVTMSQKDKDKKAARKNLLSLVYSGEKTLKILEQKVLKQYPHSNQKKDQIKRIRDIMKETCDFIKCFSLRKMTKELDQSKTYNDLLKMTDGFKQQNLKSLFMQPLDISTRTIGKFPDKDAQAAELINILQQIPHLAPYIENLEEEPVNPLSTSSLPPPGEQAARVPSKNPLDNVPASHNPAGNNKKEE